MYIAIRIIPLVCLYYIQSVTCPLLLISSMPKKIQHKDELTLSVCQ